MSGIKKEIEAMAVASVACPSCKTAAGSLCHRIGHGGGLNRIRKVKAHQRRLSKFVAENMRPKAEEFVLKHADPDLPEQEIRHAIDKVANALADTSR